MIFAILLGVLICITLHLGQCSMAKFKIASKAHFAIAMQVCAFAHELICFNQATIYCNGGTCLKDTYPVCVLHSTCISRCTISLCCIAALYQHNPTNSTPLQLLAYHSSGAKLNYRLQIVWYYTRQKKLSTAPVFQNFNIVWLVHLWVVILEPLHT